MNKTILVTGGAGFIGSNFISLLMNAYPQCHVINLDALTYAGNLANTYRFSSSPKYQFFKERIENKDALNHFFENTKIDIIVNFAAESHVDRSVLSSEPFVITNVLGTTCLLDFALKQKVSLFIQVSTDEVYGSLSQTGYFVEETPLAPNSPYSASKASADLIAKSYFHTHGLPVIITRCSNNYGPYQHPEKLIPLTITNAINDQKIPLYGTGENIRDWIYVDDHCEGILHIMQKGKIGEVYNFGGHSERSNVETISQILTLLNKPKSLITPVTDRLGHDFRYAIDTTKVSSLGWMPKHSFEQGLKKTVEWYLKEKSWWLSVKNGDYLAYYKQQYGGRL